MENIIDKNIKVDVAFACVPCLSMGNIDCCPSQQLTVELTFQKQPDHRKECLFLFLSASVIEKKGCHYS